MDEFKLSPEGLEHMRKEGEKWAEGFKKYMGGIASGCTHRWIRVSDRLPEEDETVIVHDKDHGVDVAYYEGGGIFFQLKVEGDYCDNFSGVTHWQPLPDPPKE